MSYAGDASKAMCGVTFVQAFASNSLCRRKARSFRRESDLSCARYFAIIAVPPNAPCRKGYPNA